MKHLYFFAIMLLCANMMCAQDVNTQVATRYQQSGLSMFNELVKDRGDNICFSPLSVQIALSMVQNGADGNTLKQLKQVLGTEEFSNEEIGQYNSCLTKTLTERPQYFEEEWKWYEEANPQEAFDSFYPKCELANGLWTRPDVKLYDDFVQALRTNYDAQVENVSFDTWEGIGKINDWAFDKTHGLIPSIYDEPQPSDLAVVIINALYFKGMWRNAFIKGETTKDKFLLNDDTYVETDMMCARERFDCAETPSFYAITLYYGYTNNFSMTIFVPREGTSLAPLTYDDWDATRKPTNLPINLYMPRFEISNKFDLVDLLQAMGVTDAFGEGADFSKMSEVNRSISKITQLSKIKADEEGTEAAAITVVDITDGMSIIDPNDYQDFRVDRPFYFTIQSSKSNAILFIGRVTQLEGQRGAVNSIDDIPSNSKSSSAIYDLSGRQLSIPPSKGLYIEDGRKKVAN